MNLIVSRRYFYPKMVDDGLILNTNRIQDSPILSKTNHKSRRRNGFRNSDTNQTQVGQIETRRKLVLEFHSLGGR